jgi:alkanesulfonate monooxygenase SsuD/methylene tetrahydromethanopterin reductase-like flavin-dependent oxidoreductase (luciferase family)
MKFGLFSHVPWPEDVAPAQVVDNITEEFVAGEELGFDSGWLAEHHFSRYGLGSASLMLLANIAARTKKLRLGTAVVIPPLHHPVRLAEDTATLDLLSGGRLDAGFGRGTAGYEYTGYSVDNNESQLRFQESIHIIKGLWTTPDFTFEGQHYRVKNANLVPPPVQKPHPPMYIAATRTRETQDFAAASGHSGIIGVVLDTADGLDLCCQLVDGAREAGRPMDIGGIPFFRYFYVAETEEQARRDSEPALNWTLDVNQWRRTYQRGSEVHDSLEDFRRTRTELPPSFEYLFQHRAFIGNPEQVIAKIRALQDAGIDYFGCNFSFGGMPQDKVLKSMELFAREVMPEFA